MRSRGTGRTGETAPARNAAHVRLLALAIMAMLLFGTGTLVVVALRGPAGLTPPDAMPGMAMSPGAPGAPEATGAPRPFSGLLAGWRYQASVANGPDNGFELRLRLTDEGGAPVPDSLSPMLRLTMLDHGMTMQPMPMERLAAGEYAARGRWSMGGRWRMEVLLPGGQASLDVRIP